MSGSEPALAGFSAQVAKPPPAARKSLLSFLELPDLSKAFVKPAHMRSNYYAFLLMYGGFAFATFANVGVSSFEQVYLVNQFGRTAQETGLPTTMTQVAGLLAILWAYVTDRVNFFGFGYRLPYIVLGQSVAIATYLATALVPGGPATADGWGVYVSMYLIRGFAMNLAGSAITGWVVDANVRDRIGVLTMAIAVGRFLGLAIVNMSGGYFIEAFGFLPSFVLLCGALTAPYLVIALTLSKAIVEERDPRAAAAAAADKAAKAEPSAGVLLDVIRAVKLNVLPALSLFATPAGIAIIVLTVTGSVGNTTGNFLINLFLVNQKGLTIVDISHLGTVSNVVNFPGSLFAAYALDNWDCRWSIFWANAITAITTVALIWTPRDTAFSYNVMLNVVGSCTGQAANALISGIALRAAPPKHGATFMAVFSTMVSIVGIVATQFAGHLSTLNDSYRLTFITGTCFILSGCLAVPFLGETAKVPKPAAAVASTSASSLPGAPDGATVATNPLAHTLKGDAAGANTTAVAVESVNSASAVEEWKPTRRG